MYKLTLFFFLITISGLFAKTPVIGIAPFEMQDSYYSWRNNISDYFSIQLLETKAFKIVEIDSAKLSKFEKEQKIKADSIDSDQEALKLGKFIGADYIIFGSLAYLGESYTITAKVINIETREIEFGKSVEFRQKEQLRIAIKNLAAGLSNKIVPDSAKETKVNLNTDSRHFYDTAESFGVFLQNFKKALPRITGTILSMPEAGSLEIKLSRSYTTVPEGIKLVAKRKGIEGKETGGTLYISSYKDGKIVSKYLRSEVGKFEIGDEIDSDSYTPVFAFGNIIDEAGGDDELVNNFKKNTIDQLQSLSGIKLQKNSKIDEIAEKISSDTRVKLLRKLYGDGVDYFIDGKFIGEPSKRRVDFKIWSTYTGKEVFVIKFETKL